MVNGTVAHRRDNRSILADAEKRLLIKIARALPLSIHSDHLSALALVCMCIVGIGFAAMRSTPSACWLVVVGLIGNWFGDSLDGTVARVRGHERPRFGYYVDHVIDLIGITAVFTGLAFSDLISPVVALALLVGYLLVATESFLATHATGVFRMSRWGIGPTELRIIFAVGAIYAARRAWISVPWLGAQRLFDVGGGVAIAGFAAAFLFSSVRQTIELYRAEPRPTTLNGPRARSTANSSASAANHQAPCAAASRPPG
jgi:phosphatidylglycerophosphate synthase